MYAAPALAQSTQLPAPTGQVNDFAGVIDADTKSRLEVTLRNLKERTKVNFLVATVDSTGAQDISPFSRQLAKDWSIILSYKNDKTVLLVISVATKSSIVQMTRGAQSELPDGILGELSYRMRTQLDAGRFTEALDAGVQFFLGTLAKKTGVNLDDLAVAETPTTTSSEQTAGQTTRPRVVSEAAKTEVPKEEVPKNEEPKPEEPPATVNTESPKPETTVAKNDKPVKSTPATKKSNTTKPVEITPKQNTPEDDADESEEVELTLTLPLAKRAVALKKFLDTHPESKSRVRARELLISTHAGLGDLQLKEGNNTGGVEQLLTAIDEADATVTDNLYYGVIAQIPTNLYMRGEKAAAFEAAKNVEAKFGSDPKRLLTIAGFYLGIERSDETLRMAEAAIKMAPDLAEAHRLRALGLHISLRLAEAAAEYKRTLELDPTSKASRGSIADLLRANGKNEEALSFYEEQLKVDAKDKAAKAGQVIALLELGRKNEANAALEAALAAEPRNLPLLTGLAYWHAAHQNYEKAFEYARGAVGIEPRYTWAQIALVRSLIGLKRPIEAERVMRFARQYGKFPTLDYELANVLATTGLYDEVLEVLRQSFWINEGEIETKLAGTVVTRKPDFIELLSTERKASIFQPMPADTRASAQVMKGLLTFDWALAMEKPDEKLAVATLQDFISGTDNMRAYRLIYAANRLIRSGVGYPTALELLEEARKSIDVALTVPMATMAVQADEYRQLRARAIAGGNVPDVAEAPQSVLSSILKGRIEDLSGWALFSQEKYSESIPRLKRASEILPEGTPAWRSALWHLGAALEQTGQNKEALEYYIKSYNQGEKETVRRTVIENLYRKINGSVYGLDDRIGAAALTNSSAPAQTSTPVTTAPAVTDTPSSSTETTPPGSTVTGQTSTTSNPEKPAETVTKTEPVTTELPKTEPTTTPESTSSGMTQEEAFKAASSTTRLRVKISGRILDAEKNAMGNVVVVLISPLGSVISSTTDSDGNYSFTVAPSQKAYRLIPSKDGFSFSPIDKAFAMLIENQRDVDFFGTRTP
jgi:tetratricopeptide (TPR) repeat protein